jgi:hypothetical protein
MYVMPRVIATRAAVDPCVECLYVAPFIHDHGTIFHRGVRDA